MEENWIKVEPTQSVEITELGFDEKILCKLKFRNCIDVILDDEDLEYLISELLKFKESKSLIEKLCLS